MPDHTSYCILPTFLVDSSTLLTCLRFLLLLFCCLQFIVCNLLFACLLFIGFFFMSLSLSGGVGGISRLPVTRRWGGNNEKQQIHCQSIEEIGRTTLPQKNFCSYNICIFLCLESGNFLITASLVGFDK